MKRCSKCKEFKVLECFGNNKVWKDGKYPQCKQCRAEYYQKNKEERIEYQKKYQQEHKEEINEKVKEYYQKYKKERLKYQKIYRKEHKEEIAKKAKEDYWENRKEKTQYQKEYQQKNKKKRNQYLKNKRISDSSYKLNSIISSGIRSSLKSGNGKQSWHWEYLVSYTLSELKKHLKRTLPKGYAWKDFMEGKLHIDHIHPQAIFQYEKPEDLDFQVCWGLDNLRLLPSEENRRKHTKLIKPFQKTFAVEIKLRDKCVSPI